MKMSELPVHEVGCVVVGAGVIGLAAARELALAGEEVVILEAANQFGSETSARNSEVIHAGIYYPQGSLKARACVAGKHALYAYLQSRNLPFKQCGKFIVATNDDQLTTLDQAAEKASANGVEDLEFISGAKAVELEPSLTAVAALVSPSTGIVDSHAYMLSLLGEAESNGAMLALNTRVDKAEILADGRTQLVCSGEEPCILIAQKLVNAAGHGAPALAKRMQGFPDSHTPQQYFAKGNYFMLSGRAPFSRLIYPVPVAGGLGVHLTLDMGGQARFGPDVEWIDELDYQVSPSRGDKFYDAVRTYWPGLKDGDLAPAYCGVRPKLAGPGQPDADFTVYGPDDHGVEGQVHLFGIESPGLTSSLALADYAAAKLLDRAPQILL